MLRKINNKLKFLFDIFFDYIDKYWRELLFISCGLVGFFLIIYPLYVKSHNTQVVNINTENKSIKTERVVTKEAFDEMVQQAADGKYIKSVLTDPKLPQLPLQNTSKKAVPLQPYPAEMSNDNTLPANPSPKQNTVPQEIQRCSYKEQIYVPGDIVKTDQGWIRCVPIFNFSQDGAKQLSSAAWTSAQ